MIRKQTRQPGKCRENPRLEMTSMIDVVFLLLIFFIVTLRPEDVLSRAEVSRVTAGDVAAEGLVEIVVGHRLTGFSMNGRVVTLSELDRDLGRLASVDRSVSIAIKCTAPSKHQKLVELLDLCAKHQLERLSVHSL